MVLINAIFSSPSHQTMRIYDNIKKKVVTVLINLESTHNFLDLVVAKRTICSIQTTNPMKVAITDRTRITSDAICRQC